MSAIRYLKPAVPQPAAQDHGAPALVPPRQPAADLPQPAHPAGAQAVNKSLYPK